jgi:hypothetical protein
MESTVQQEGISQDLAAELDRLGEKVERAALLIKRLEGERAELRELAKRFQELQKENQALRRERAEVCRRLGDLIEKVDLIQEGS